MLGNLIGSVSSLLTTTSNLGSTLVQGLDCGVRMLNNEIKELSQDNHTNQTNQSNTGVPTSDKLQQTTERLISQMYNPNKPKNVFNSNKPIQEEPLHIQSNYILNENGKVAITDGINTYTTEVDYNNNNIKQLLVDLLDIRSLLKLTKEIGISKPLQSVGLFKTTLWSNTSSATFEETKPVLELLVYIQNDLANKLKD